ncbi:hypothetical protein NESM_000796500 [Novymonas esmeraldas]|uniref:Uncharacterized protein n=1 Tax=Novymonas esmeraldas TaxID=1808958 RepID=A0AAW0EZC0_9TRYP
MSDVRVTFAFLTPPTVQCCTAPVVDHEERAERSRSESQMTRCDSRTAVIKVFDYDAGVARAYHLEYPRGTTMRGVYALLAETLGAGAGGTVCVALPSVSHDRAMRLLITRVLEAADDVPDVLFCQKAAPPYRGPASSPYWLIVNVLICGNDGSLLVGHVPCLVPTAGAAVTRDGVCADLSALLRMGVECERHLRECALFCCVAERKSIVLHDPFYDGASPSQVAVLYSAVDVGDVVLVSSPRYRSANVTRPSVLQGVVVRRFVEDGVALHDVREVDTAVVLEGLPCTQLVPL